VFAVVCGRAGVRPALALTFVSSLVFKYVVPATSPVNVQNLPFFFWFYWATGAYVAEVWVAEGRPVIRRHAWLIGVLAPVWVLSNYYRPLADHVWMIDAVFFAVVLDALLRHAPVRPPGWSRAVAAVGLVSYSLYLWHQPLIPPLSGLVLRTLHAPTNPLTLFTLALPVCLAALVALAWGSYRGLELTSVALGRRLLRPKPEGVG
jgi:peptidoglycan/LPS O-acetylase OafA/YrhL